MYLWQYCSTIFSTLFVPIAVTRNYLIHLAWRSVWFCIFSSYYHIFLVLPLHSLTLPSIACWSWITEILPIFRHLLLHCNKVLHQPYSVLMHLKTKWLAAPYQQTVPENLVWPCKTICLGLIVGWHTCALRVTLQILVVLLDMPPE